MNCDDEDNDGAEGFLVLTVVLTDCDEDMGMLGVYFCLLLAEVTAEDEWERVRVGSPP